MQAVTHEYQFSSIVAENTQEHEFIVEFTPLRTDGDNENKPIKITRNFDELLDFFDCLEAE